MSTPKYKWLHCLVWLRHMEVLPKQYHILWVVFPWPLLDRLDASPLVNPSTGSPRIVAELYKLYRVISFGPNRFSKCMNENTEPSILLHS